MQCSSSIPHGTTISNANRTLLGDVVAKATFEGGSTRSEMKLRFDLIPKEAIEALARRLTLGAERHGENNWKQGGAEFRKATLNHLMKHLLDYMENGNRDDDNSDAIICNAAFLCYFEKLYPFGKE